MYLAEKIDKQPIKKAEPSKVEVALKKPSFTKQPTLVVSVEPKQTATLLANIDGVPRPSGIYLYSVITSLLA